MTLSDTKPTILLLHGALGSRTQFDHLVPSLERSMHVLTMNFAGHGGRPTARSFDMELFTDDLMTFLDENGLDRTHIFGFSMGGYVALKTALNYPDRIGHIATLGTKFNWTPESAAKELRMLDPDSILEKVPHFAERLRTIHHPQDWKTVVRRTGEMMTGLGSGKRLSENDLQKIGNRVIIGIGDQDEMVSVEESAWAADNLPDGTLTILQGVKHPIEKLNPDIVQNLLFELLEI